MAEITREQVATLVQHARVIDTVKLQLQELVRVNCDEGTDADRAVQAVVNGNYIDEELIIDALYQGFRPHMQFEEMDFLISFYLHPMGVSLMTKLPQMTIQMSQIMEHHMRGALLKAKVDVAREAFHETIEAAAKRLH